MKIAVVIPALDEAERIEGTVESAFASSHLEESRASQNKDELEVVVVDGGSRDDTAELAQRAGARVVTARPGRSAQMQAGVAASTGDVVLFLHADTCLPPEWRIAVGRAMGDLEVVGGAFQFRFDRPEGVATSQRFVYSLIELGVRARVALFGLPYGDQAIFVRRAVLEEIGGVPRVPIMEDLDLVAGMKARGRMALLGVSVSTSARRYRTQGPLRTVARHGVAVGAWLLGMDRDRVAAWYRG